MYASPTDGKLVMLTMTACLSFSFEIICIFFCHIFSVRSNDFFPLKKQSRGFFRVTFLAQLVCSFELLKFYFIPLRVFNSNTMNQYCCSARIYKRPDITCIEMKYLVKVEIRVKLLDAFSAKHTENSYQQTIK